MLWKEQLSIAAQHLTGLEI